MIWLKRKIRDWVEQANEEDHNFEKSINIKQEVFPKEDDSIPDDCDSYTLRVWKATGGRCIQYKKYDRYNDKLHTELYIVSDGEDLGEAVTNIVIQQALRGN
jgi:hypothetical protein